MKTRGLGALLFVFICVICSADESGTVLLRGTLSTEKVLGISQKISRVIRVPGESREKEEISLGSITSICPDPSWLLQDSLRNWWITPAHVILSSLEPIEKMHFKLPSGKDLKLEMVDTSMDLALLSSSLPLEPCVSLERELHFESISNIETTPEMDPVSIQIETPYLLKWSFKNRGLSTFLGLTKENGIPGRDDMGPVLEVIAPGFLGQSGGALLKETSQTLRLIGMILAVDDLGIKLAALPSTTLLKRINDHFLKKTPSVIDRIRTPSGTLYLKNNLTHLRQWTSNAYRDAGSGGLNDGGSGGLNDGGNSRLANNRAPFSGIMENNKRWLTLGADWVEYEAFEKLATFDLESLKSLLHGIYETNGNLFARQADSALPQWLPTLSGQNALAYRFNVGIRKKKDIAKSILANKTQVFYQENVLPSVGRNLFLYLPPSAQTRGIVFMFTLAKDQHCKTEECQVSLIGNYSIQTSETTFEKAIEDHRSHPKNWRKLKNNGLRYFYDQSLSILLTRKSGFQVRLYPQDEKLDFAEIITGPVTY